MVSLLLPAMLFKTAVITLTIVGLAWFKDIRSQRPWKDVFDRMTLADTLVVTAGRLPNVSPPTPLPKPLY